MKKLKTIVWGAGEVGRDVIHNILTGGVGNKDKDVIAVIDNNPHLQGRKFFGINIFSPERIDRLDFDLVLICTYDQGSKMQIFYSLLDKGVDKDKIVLHPSIRLRRSEATGFGSERLDYVKKMLALMPPPKGSVAECGVNRGDFACRLNTLFYDRKLFLFDTFEGFDERDFEVEDVVSAVSALLVREYDENGYYNHSIESVMNKMPYPENVIIKKGWVPDTLEGVDDEFCFVNLDMDIYSPTLAGLRHFYPKLSRGGIILLHDYYNWECVGVSKAVCDFEAEAGALIKAPSYDYCSLAIIKP